MAQLKYWDATLGQYVVLPGQGGQAVAYAPVQATPPNAAAPALSPPMGFLWIDTSTSAPGNLPFYPPQTPPVSGTNTYTDASGEVWISKTGSAWRRARDVATARAFLSTADQTQSVSGFAQVILNGISYDPLSSFSGGSYTVPVAGRYAISGGIGLHASPATAGNDQAVIYVNGTDAVYGQTSYFPASQVAWPSVNVGDILRLNAGDVVTLNHWLSASFSVTIMADTKRTWLAAHFLDPATP